MRHKTVFFAFIMLALSGQSFAGLKWADVGVNGLTCSMCSRSVEMSLLRLTFVDRVNMSLVDGNFLPRKERAELKEKYVVLKASDQEILHVIQG